MATYKKNTIRIIDENNIQVTKAFAKQARIFGTPEYKKWKEIKADLPEAIMVTKKIKKNPDKKTNRNKTYENMELFIKQQKNAEELLKEFERQKKLSKIMPYPYAAVLEWFENTFKNPDEYQPLFAEMSAEKEKQKTENTGFIIENYATTNTPEELAA